MGAYTGHTNQKYSKDTIAQQYHTCLQTLFLPVMQVLGTFNRVIILGTSCFVYTYMPPPPPLHNVSMFLYTYVSVSCSQYVCVFNSNCGSRLCANKFSYCVSVHAAMTTAGTCSGIEASDTYSQFWNHSDHSFAVKFGHKLSKVSLSSCENNFTIIWCHFHK